MELHEFHDVSINNKRIKKLVNLDAVEWVDPPDDLANDASVWGLHMRSGKPITVENSEQTRGFLDSITRSTAPPELLI